MEKVLIYREFIDYLLTLKDQVVDDEENKCQKKLKAAEIDIPALKNGDHKAFELVFHRYYGKVRAFLKILTKSEDLADELSQSVFVNLWTYRHSIDPVRSFDAYIYTITRNAAMNALKKRTRENINVYDYPDQDGGMHTDDLLIARETEMLVKMTVSRMPPKRKLVYQMSRYEHKTNDEISRELAISKKMVEKHLRDSLADIKEVLKFLIIFLG